jgi:gliding motility-associated-like protein
VRLKFIIVLFLQLLISCCKLIAQIDSCATNTFQKAYGQSNIYGQADDIVETPDKGFISVGYGATNYDCFLMKIDKKGAIVWLKQISDTAIGFGFMKRIIRLKNGNYVAMGRASKPDFEDTWIIKFDENGNILWSKELTNPNGISTDSYDICETEDKGLAIAGGYAPYANAGAFLIFKLDANGNYVWGKGYINDCSFNGIMEKNGFLYVAGTDQSISGLIIKMQSSDGTIVGGSTIRIDNKKTIFKGIAEKNNKLYIDGYNTNSDNYGITQVIVILDTSFKIEKVHKIDFGFNNSWEVPGMFPTADGGYIVTESNDTQISDLFLCKVSYDGVIQWKRQYTRNGDQRTRMIKSTTDNGIIGVGTTNNIGYYNSNPNDFYIFKTDSLGITPDCPLTDPYATILNPAFTSYQASILADATTFPIITTTPLAIAVTIPVNTFCEKVVVPSCYKIQITGKDSICSLRDTITYIARRNQNCILPVKWNIDTAFATIISSSDSTIKLRFKKSGITKLFSFISDACENIGNSLAIYIFNSPINLDIGPDRSICKNGSYKLHAGAGFKSYLWQDGTVDSNFTVTAPALYYVSTINYCGIVFKDTVNIVAAPSPLVDIGHDTSICNNDTLSLQATSGFTSYSWKPDYNISSLTGNVARVFPNIDTVYIVSAINSSGCPATDSIKIKVYHPLQVNLGDDTSFCNGNSITLNAGASFVSYLWNTGSKSQKISVAISGQYIVTAKDMRGCNSIDTSVVSVFLNPTINLQRDSVLCEGADLLLNAGAGFINYLWQDGSVGQTFLVSAIGKYWLTVTDHNSCKGSDTTEIKRLAALPSNFVNKEASVCEGEKTILSSISNFDTYLWSTGETVKQIVITSPGAYWLQIKSNEGCFAKEYINVTSKIDCIRAVYFPNAFTPNNDGRNDVFEAHVYGILSSFRLVIYNRFGQKVFQTNDSNKGWDGKFDNAQLDTGIFAWYSEYRFNNEILKIQKGVLTLIR